MELFGNKMHPDDEVYAQYDNCKKDLRDHLATDRTILSNQNTFLAYIRTALTLIIGGLTFVRFFDMPVYFIIGWIFVPAGIITFFIGLVRYNRHRKTLQRIQRD